MKVTVFLGLFLLFISPAFAGHWIPAQELKKKIESLSSFSKEIQKKEEERKKLDWGFAEQNDALYSAHKQADAIGNPRAFLAEKSHSDPTLQKVIETECEGSVSLQNLDTESVKKIISNYFRDLEMKKIEGKTKEVDEKKKQADAEIKTLKYKLAQEIDRLSLGEKGLTTKTVLSAEDRSFLQHDLSNPTRPFSKTFNSHGDIVFEKSRLVQSFLSDSKGKEVADLGAAVGNNTLAALQAGAKKVIAIDLDPTHIRYLIQHTPSEYLPRLQVSVGRVPQELDLKENSLDGVLLSHVLHYMSPEEIQETLKLAFKALRSGGKIYIQALTPNCYVYEKAKNLIQEREKSGEDWPYYLGKIDKDFMPTGAHPQTQSILRRELKKAGFSVEKAEEYNFRSSLSPDSPWGNSVPEGAIVGVIAVK